MNIFQIQEGPLWRYFHTQKKFNSYVIPKSITYHIIIINKVIVIMIFNFFLFFAIVG